ncbi:odorant receptor 92 [Nasonia vitripennis]|uniref:Odorant receptor n=1 Tax=Nasonia vitripennis TaxID=7425 RepID=A0A7M6UG43_NASVI|nr:odorant receptor 92 [Nasonia vitripennis]
MQSLKVSFTILTYCGIWQPIYWTSGWHRTSFNFCRVVFRPLPYLLASAQLARIALVDMSFEELTEVIFILLSIVNICCKSVSILMRRADLIKLTKMLGIVSASPQDSDEFNIQHQYHQFIRYVTLSSLVLVEITAITFLIPPFFQPENNRTLPFKIWLPYDYSMDKLFWITYFPESITIILASLISVSSNTLIFGFLIEACGQFELLNHRFMTMPLYIEDFAKGEKITTYEVCKLEKQLLSRNIRHHTFIFEFVDIFKKTFSSAIIGQYIVSSLVISTSVYQLSTNTTMDVVFFTNLLYLMCMLLEFFLYCWFGNELTVKSEDFGRKVFRTNWLALSTKSNKDIFVAMLRSSKPIIVSTGFFAVLSLESFMKIIKLSFSAFNVLRTASDYQ